MSDEGLSISIDPAALVRFSERPALLDAMEYLCGLSACVFLWANLKDEISKMQFLRLW